MPFKKLPGGIGRIYVPDRHAAGPRKHDCKDCFFCQMCSDLRCRLCRKNKCARRPSVAARKPRKP